MTKETFFEYLDTLKPSEFTGIFNNAQFRPQVLDIPSRLFEEAKEYLPRVHFDEAHSSFQYKGVAVVVRYGKK